MSVRDPHDCGGDAAAYALGALEPDEAQAFRAHVESCVVCRDELAAFGEVVAQLPAAAPQHRVPRGLRRRMRRAMRAQMQSAQKPARRWRALPRPALAGALTLAAVLAAVGGLELSSGGSSGARLIRASVIGSSGSAQLRLAGARAELIVHHLPSPPPGKIYEVWLRHAANPPSPTSALFGVTSRGSGDVAVPGDLNGVTEVLVTPEPAGGSRVPTHSPVIVARLT